MNPQDAIQALAAVVRQLPYPDRGRCERSLNELQALIEKHHVEAKDY